MKQKFLGPVWIVAEHGCKDILSDMEVLYPDFVSADFRIGIFE
jgi:hypothetical protein